MCRSTPIGRCVCIFEKWRWRERAFWLQLEWVTNCNQWREHIIQSGTWTDSCAGGHRRSDKAGEFVFEQASRADLCWKVKWKRRGVGPLCLDISHVMTLWRNWIDFTIGFAKLWIQLCAESHRKLWWIDATPPSRPSGQIILGRSFWVVPSCILPPNK